MNKNRLKAIFISVAVTLGVVSGFFAPLASAVDPGGGNGLSVQIPITYTRDKATLKSGYGGCKTFSSTDCYDVVSGIGMYAYVGSHTPERANIGFASTGITVVDATDNTQVYTRDYNVDSNGVLTVNGLKLNHSYNFSFAYDDTKSSDIVAAIKQTADYCKKGTITGKSDGTIGYRISQQLTKGCDRYTSEPFLPASTTVVVPAEGTFVLSKPGMKLDTVALQADAPAASTTSGNIGDDNCPLPSDDGFRWIACPAFAAGRTLAERMDRMIENFLYTPTQQIFSNNTKAAWSSFRTLGVVLILLAGLVMVISQAVGLELFDAYTIKKVLPRLLIAAIGITLSWPLLQFVITAFNDLGGWIYDLILTPFSGVDTFYNGGSATVIIALLIGVTIKGGIIALGSGGLMSLLGTFILALLLGLIVLALRQAIILVAVIMAPLAIAAYILPGTQKLWAFWKDAFLTSMFIFPIIMAFIATGRALAFVLASIPNSTEMHLLSVLVYFAPYFLLPFAFKLAGGLMSTVFSIANDRSRGMFDTRRKKREAIREDRLKRAANNSLWDKNSRIGRKANTAAGWVVDPKGNTQYKMRNVPGFRKAGQGIAAHIQAETVKQTSEIAKEFNDLFGSNDKAFRAAGGMFEGFSASTQDRLEEAGIITRDGNGKITQRHVPHTIQDYTKLANVLRQGSGSDIIAADVLDGAKGRLATLSRDAEVMKASVEAASLMGLASHGFATPDDVAQVGQSLKAKYGNATAQSLTSQAQLMGQRGRPDLKNGYGKLIDSEGNFINGIREGGRALDLIGSLSQQDVAGAKSGFMDDMKQYYREILQPTAEESQMAVNFSRLSDEDKRNLEKQQPDAYKRQARAAKAANMRDATLDQLAQWVGPYSGASVDVKVAAQQWMDDFQIRDEITKRARYIDPTDPTGANRRQPDDQNQQGGAGK